VSNTFSTMSAVTRVRIGAVRTVDWEPETYVRSVRGSSVIHVPQLSEVSVEAL